MAKDKTPATPAVRMLRQNKVDFTPLPYAYEAKGGTKVAARELGLEEHAVIKTLVLENNTGAPLIVLMHGDAEVSLKALARELGVKAVKPVDPISAQRHTGYQVGGISPFGTKKRLPVYAQSQIFDLPRIFINAGKRGLLAGLDPAELKRLLEPRLVDVMRG